MAGIKVGPGEGERADFPSLGNRYIIRSEQTGGRFALIEHTIPPHALAAPIHTHENEDEYSYVLSGRMGAMIGDDVVEAGPGELVVKPRGIPHAFWNAGDEEVRLLELISPGGFDQYFADMAPLLNSDGRARPQRPLRDPGPLRPDDGHRVDRHPERALRPRPLIA